MVPASGSTSAKIMIVGEAPGEQEVLRREPFVGASGQELNRMLHEAGIMRSECFMTNVCRERPPENDITVWIGSTKKCPDASWQHVGGKWLHPFVAAGLKQLQTEINLVRPNVVIAFGNTAMWALTGKWGIKSWRGSLLTFLSPAGDTLKLIPAYHPAYILRDWSARQITVQDLKRAKAQSLTAEVPRSDYSFVIRPSFPQTMEYLDGLLRNLEGHDGGVSPERGEEQHAVTLSVDIETRAGHIACLGIATDTVSAFCIPFMCAETPEGYWNEEEELAIVLALQSVLCHPSARIIGQNFIYDTQYIYRHWRFVPRFARDTMLGHHCCFAGTPKGLDYLSSMYCENHVYWKDEGKTWDRNTGEEQLWTYNCLAGDTKILCANSIYKDLKEIQVGEAIMAFEEEGSDARYARRLKVAVVTRTFKSRKKLYRFDFSDGTFLRGTLDHKIISTRGTDSRSEFKWKELGQLKLDDRVVSLGQPWDLGVEYEDAWFAGILDGEGTVGISRTDNKAYPRIGFSQKRGRVFDLGCKVLEKHGFSVRISDKNNATYVDVNGGLQEQLRLLGTFSTLRIAQNFMNLCSREGASGFAGVPRPSLIRITEQEEEDVYDVTTTEGTFIAGGIVVHNCKDCVITFECDLHIQETVDKLGLRAQHNFQQSLFWPVLEAMVRGVRVDTARRKVFATELQTEIATRELWFESILGHPLNPRSPLQMKHLFYEDLKQKPIISRKTGKVSLDEEALEKICTREPILKPLGRRITEHRTLGVFKSTFVEARLDSDSRLRCSYNIAGTETFRLSSSTNAFDSGLNLQNIPKGNTGDGLQLPNVRRLFVPDPGFTFFDADLDRADLQVVVWESADEELRSMLLGGVDIHAENAKLLGISRQLAKTWVHGTNYGGSARTMAIHCGVSVAKAEQMRARWFAAHPGIAGWHKRVERDLHSRHCVTNVWGYRRFYFDRIDGLLPEALAWIPQSTVAVTINRIWKLIYDTLPDVQVLLQVHDSLAGQVPTAKAAACFAAIREVGRRVVVPYDKPLNIPLGLKTSETSWGDCQ